MSNLSINFLAFLSLLIAILILSFTFLSVLINISQYQSMPQEADQEGGAYISVFLLYLAASNKQL